MGIQSQNIGFPLCCVSPITSFIPLCPLFLDFCPLVTLKLSPHSPQVRTEARARSKISGNGVYMYTDVGVRFADFISFFLK